MAERILVSPLTSVGTEDSPVQVLLSIEVSDSEWIGLYDRLEIWRADLSSDGPYVELTANTTLPAQVPADGGPVSALPGPDVNIVGRTLLLQFDYDGTDELPITFTGTDPLTTAVVATQITAARPTDLLAYVDTSGRLVVQTTKVGGVALLRVVPWEDPELDAAPLLELSVAEPASFARGREARLHLVAGKTRYEFTDAFGSDGAYYTTRFRNSLTGAVSGYSAPFTVNQRLGLDSSNVVVGFVDLIRVDGKPAQATKVVIAYNSFSSLVNGLLPVVGVSVERVSDKNGHVEFTVIRGSRLTVAVAGTSLVREIDVPVDPAITAFNLFDSTVAVDIDRFDVAVPEVVYAERRSL